MLIEPKWKEVDKGKWVAKVIINLLFKTQFLFKQERF